MKHLSIPALALALASLACGGQSQIDVTRTVVAFADADGDGARGPDEAGLPGVLVISDSNIHGAMTRLARFTDESGEVAISVTYTHFFNIKVVAPCGYYPSTTAAFDGIKAKDVIDVGFAPDAPQAGTAIVRFHVWEDANQDGSQDEDEEPVGTVDLPLDIPVEGAASTSFGPAPGSGESNELAVHVEGGRGEISLGNSCGVLRVNLSGLANWEAAFTAPLAVFEAYEGKPTGVLRFAYSGGEMEIEIGLKASDE